MLESKEEQKCYEGEMKVEGRTGPFLEKLKSFIQKKNVVAKFLYICTF